MVLMCVHVMYARHVTNDSQHLILHGGSGHFKMIVKEFLLLQMSPSTINKTSKVKIHDVSTVMKYVSVFFINDACRKMELDINKDCQIEQKDSV